MATPKKKTTSNEDSRVYIVVTEGTMIVGVFPSEACAREAATEDDDMIVSLCMGTTYDPYDSYATKTIQVRH